MRLRSVALALAAILTFAPFAQAGVTFQTLAVPDPEGAPIEVGVWSPDNAASPGKPLPLVVMSHGTGGYFGSHQDTAEALAEAGFIVAAPTHTGDNWRDHSRAMAIWDRSRQLKVVVDHLLAEWPGRARIDARRLGAFGFSAGGFTVLMAAGGEPDFARTTAFCQAHPDHFGCRLTAAAGPNRPRPRPVVHDPRIRALVVAAPALGYTFGREGLVSVRQPVQLWRAQDDQTLPHPFYAEAVREALPNPPDYHVIPRAGHLDFLAPCSSELVRRAPRICTSAPGFDRVSFHAEFNREVVAFFRRTLADPR